MDNPLWDYHKAKHEKRFPEETPVGQVEDTTPEFWAESLPAYQQTDLPLVDIGYDLAQGRGSSVFTGQTPSVRSIGEFFDTVAANALAAVDFQYTADEYMDLIDEGQGEALRTIAPLFGDETARPTDEFDIPDSVLSDPRDDAVRVLIDEMTNASTKAQRKAMLSTWLNEKKNIDILQRTPWYSALFAGLVSLPVDLSAIADVLLTRGALKGAGFARASQKYAAHAGLGVLTATATAVPRELFLHGGQSLRDVDTSIQAVAIEAVLSGLLSPGFEYLGDAWARAAARRAPVVRGYPDAPEEVPLLRLPYTSVRRSDIPGAKTWEGSMTGGAFYEHLAEFHRIVNKSMEYDILTDQEWAEFDAFIVRSAEEHRLGVSNMYRPTLHGVNPFIVEPVVVRQEPGLVTSAEATRRASRNASADEMLNLLRNEREVREARLGLIATKGDPLDFDSVIKAFGIDPDTADPRVLSAIRNLISDFDLDTLGARVARGGDEYSDPESTLYAGEEKGTWKTRRKPVAGTSGSFRQDAMSDSWWGYSKVSSIGAFYQRYKKSDIERWAKTDMGWSVVSDYLDTLVREHLARNADNPRYANVSGSELRELWRSEIKVDRRQLVEWAEGWYEVSEVDSTGSFELVGTELSPTSSGFKASTQLRVNNRTRGVEIKWDRVAHGKEWTVTISPGAVGASARVPKDSALYDALEYMDPGDTSFTRTLTKHTLDLYTREIPDTFGDIMGMDFRGGYKGIDTIEVRAKLDANNPIHRVISQHLEISDGEVLGRVYHRKAKVSGKDAFVVEGVEHGRTVHAKRRVDEEKRVLATGSKYLDPTKLLDPRFSLARLGVDKALARAAIRAYHKTGWKTSDGEYADGAYQEFVVMGAEAQAARLGDVLEFGKFDAYTLGKVGDLDLDTLPDLQDHSSWHTTHGLGMHGIDRSFREYNSDHWRLRGEISKDYEGLYKTPDGESITAGGYVDIYFDRAGKIVSSQVVDSDLGAKAYPTHLGKSLSDIVGEEQADKILKATELSDRSGNIQRLTESARDAAVEERVKRTEEAHAVRVKEILGGIRDVRTPGMPRTDRLFEYFRRAEGQLGGYLFGEAGGDIEFFKRRGLADAQRYVYLRVAVMTGMRTKELEGLTLSMLGGARGSRYIVAKSTKAKTVETRRVPISDEMHDMLQTWMSILEHNELLGGDHPHTSPLFVPMRSTGAPSKSWASAVRNDKDSHPSGWALRKFGYDGPKPKMKHSPSGELRHMFANLRTQYLRLSGVPEAVLLRETSQLMGHAAQPGYRAGSIQQYMEPPDKLVGKRGARLTPSDLRFFPVVPGSGIRLNGTGTIGTGLRTISGTEKYVLDPWVEQKIYQQLESAVLTARTSSERLTAHRNRLFMAISGVSQSTDYHMALRNVEYSKLLWSDIDLDMGTISYVVGKQRSSRKAVVKLPAQMLGDFIALRRAQGELGIYSGAEPPVNSLVFKSRSRSGSHKVLGSSEANRVYRKILEMAGVSLETAPRSLHNFRSVRAEELFAEGGSFGEVQSLLGHKGLDSMKHYLSHQGLTKERRATLRALEAELRTTLGKEGKELTLENALDLTLVGRDSDAHVYRGMTEAELVDKRADIVKLWQQSSWDTYRVGMVDPHMGPKKGVKSVAAMTDQELIDRALKDDGKEITAAQAKKIRDKHYAITSSRNTAQVKLLLRESELIAEAVEDWKRNYADMVTNKGEQRELTVGHLRREGSLEYGVDHRSLAQNLDALEAVMAEAGYEGRTGKRVSVPQHGRAGKPNTAPGHGWSTIDGNTLRDMPPYESGEGPFFSTRGGERRASYEAKSSGEDILRALNNPSPIDALHELLHLLENRILHKDVPIEMRKGITDEDIDILEEFMGDRSTREGKEKFVKGALEFLEDDTAPDFVLYGLYKKVLAWIRHVFKWGEMEQEGTMSPEVRKVFSKIIRKPRAKNSWDAHILQKVRSMVGDSSRADAVVHANLQVDPEARAELRLLREQILAGEDPDDTRFWEMVLRGADMDVVELVSIRRDGVAGNLVRKAMLLTPGTDLMSSENPISQRIANMLSDTGVIAKDRSAHGLSLERQKYLGEMDAHYIAQHYKDMSRDNRKQGGVLSTNEFDRMVVSIYKYSSGDPTNIDIDPGFSVEIDGVPYKPFKADALNEVDVENLKKAVAYFVKQQEVQDKVIIQSGQWSRSGLERVREDYMNFYGERVMPRMFDREKVFAEKDQIVSAIMSGWKEYYDKVVTGEGGVPGRETQTLHRLMDQLEDMVENKEAFEGGRKDVFQGTHMQKWRADKFKKEVRAASERVRKQEALIKGLVPNKDKATAVWDNWRRDPLDSGMLDAFPGAISITDETGKALMSRKVVISDRWLEPWLYSSAGKNSIDFNEYHGLRSLGVSRMGTSDAKAYIARRNELEDLTTDIERKIEEALGEGKARTATLQTLIDNHQDYLEELRLNTEIIKILEDQRMIVDKSAEKLESDAAALRGLSRERAYILSDMRKIERMQRNDTKMLSEGAALEKERLDADGEALMAHKERLSSNSDAINAIAKEVGDRVGSAQSSYTKTGRSYSASAGSGLGVSRTGRDYTLWDLDVVSPVDYEKRLRDRIDFGGRVRSESTSEGAKIGRDTNSVGRLGVAIERNAESRYKGKRSAKFVKEVEGDLAALNIMHASVYGTWGVDDHVGFNWIGKNLRNLVYSMGMGKIVLSSTPDIALSFAVNGYGPTLSAMAKVTSHRLKADLPFIHTKEGQGDRFMFSDMLYAMEVTMAQLRMQRMYGITPAEHLGTTSGLRPPTMGQRVSTGTGHLGQWTSSLSGITRWNGYWKQVNAEAAQSNITRMGLKLTRGEELTGEEAQYLRRFNLGNDEVHDMARLQQRFGSSEPAAAGEFYFAGQLQWESIDGIDATRVKFLRSKLEGTMSRAADMAIITPNSSNVPGWTTKTEVGRMVSQFKKFFLAGSVEVSLPLAQRLAAGSPLALANFATLITCGSFVYMAQSFLKGEDPLPALRNPEKYTKEEWWSNVGTLVVESIDRSGAIGVLAEPLNFADRLGMGPGSLVGGEGLSRSRSRPGSQILLGPVVGKLDEGLAMMAEFARMGLDGKPISARGAKRLRRLTPLGNLLPLSAAVDVAPSMYSAVQMGAAQDKQWGSKYRMSFMDRYYKSFRFAEHRALDSLGVPVNYSGYKRRIHGLGIGG